LRLQEACWLILTEGLDATEAAFQVGYDDAPHFSREYKRLFGDPALRDVQGLRELTLVSEAA
jgi:AraC-like DNA-binding protein